MDCSSTRVPRVAISQAVATASLGLEHLSASFIVDARDFFQTYGPSWETLNLTSLALTSQLLVPDGNPTEIDDMLLAAAAASNKMPNLKTMEIWNGREGFAMLFKYQPGGRGRPAVISWRGTWDFTLRAGVIRAWEAVSRGHGSHQTRIVNELLSVGNDIKSHGDAIHHLKLSGPVIRPVSLHQIRTEARMHEGAHDS